MTARGSTAFRTLAFGAIDMSFWGVAWMHGTGPEVFVGVGAGDRAITAAAALHDGGESEDWRLEGDGIELTASSNGIGVEPSAAEPASGFDALCRVHGRLLLDGAERDIDCIGRRGAYAQRSDVERLESIRDVSAWFEPADGLALVALRPRKSRGQDSDLVTAVVFDPDTRHTVDDPRLSTTYTASGQPLRAGLEFWLGDDDEQQHPRRALGEAAGAGAAGQVGRFDVLAQPFRWQSRGRDGAGVYLLARQR
jgi:hypothetical protein